MSDITELKQAESQAKANHAQLLAKQGELSESETLFRGLFDNMTSGCAIYKVINDGSKGSDYLIKNFNASSLVMEGKTLEQVVGKRLFDLRPTIDDYGLIPVMKQVWETGVPAYHPVTIYQDEIFSNYYENYVFRLPSGEIVTIYNDVTERKSAQIALKESIERFELAMQFSNDGLYDWNLVTNQIYYSHGWKKMLGYGEDEIKNEFSEWERLTRPEDVNAAWTMITELLAGKRDLFKLEFKMRHKDGHWVDILSRANVVFNENGKAVRVVGTHVDISDRKRVEEDLRRYEHIVSRAPDMLALVDRGYVYLAANTEYLKAFGKTSAQLIGSTVADVFGEEFFATVIRPKAERCLAGEDLRYRYWYEFPAAGKRYLDVAYTPYFGQGTEIQGYVATSRDITHTENLQAQLLQAQKMESVGRLAGGVAHDYNNALNVIIGFAELAMEDADASGPLCANLKEVIDAAKRATHITRQLLAFARKQTITPKVLDLNEHAEGMLKMLRRLIGEDIDLAWLPGAGLWTVKLDPSQLDQILANLCVNARDAIEDVGKVTIQSGNASFDEAYCADHPGFVPGDFVMLAVGDNGCGISKDILGHIFEPFFTTKAVNKGTGLGLATVYGIVKQNNGFINIYSEPNQGTLFKIYLPRQEDLPAEKPLEPAAAPPHGRGETVLIVEDDPSILRLAQKILDGLGYGVLTAGTTKEALESAEKHAGGIHLLVTDVIMPEMNGRDLAQRLRLLFPEIKSLFMSGYTADIIARHGVLDPEVHFIQKPFSKRDLATAVRKALDA